VWHIWFLAAGVLHAPLYSSPPPLALLLTVACALLMFSRRLWSSLPACLLLGLTFGSWHLQQKCAAQLLPEFEQQVFDLSFQIISIPGQSGRSQVFLAQVTESHCSGSCPQLNKGTMRLSWYQHSPFPQTAQTLQAGQLWRAQVKLRRPRGFVNPDGFDYHAWLLAQDVIATGYIAREGEYLGQSFTWAAERSAIEEELASRHASPYRRFWAALLIGEQAAIKTADWATLQATGTVHLLVISGLHISLAATWCFVLGALAARFAGLLHRGSNLWLMHYLPPVCACLGAAYYAALAGFNIPTQRALGACLVLMLCRLLGLNFSAFTLLGMAALAVGILEPFAWMSSGFWLSFLAVAVLFYSLGGRGRVNAASALVRAQMVLSVGLLLPLLALGQGTSLLSPLANLVAVPVVSVVLTPLLLVATLCSSALPEVTTWLLHEMDWIFGNLWWFLEWVQARPVSLWWPAKPLSGIESAVAAAGVILILAPAGLQLRCLGGVWLCLALLPRPDPDFLLRLTVLEVGQGTAVVLETPGRTWLYDTGPQFSEEFDAGSRIVAPYLRSRGVKNLNLIISHGDMDHAGGAGGIISAFPIERFLYGEPLAAFPGLGEPCRAGHSWQQDQVNWRVLWPPELSETGNNSSCTLLLTFTDDSKEVRLLLPGDIDSNVEMQLLADLQEPVDWVLAPHHGSKTSSNLMFVRQLAAQHVVFSAGFNNRYGHPHPRVVQRWQEAGAQLYNTATEGALIFTWRAGGLEIERLRQSRRRLWH
jgi:competence protein ComEC